MTLNKNILAQGEIMIEEHQQSYQNLCKMIQSPITQALKMLEFQNVVMTGCYRELAIFRMMEKALKDGTFEESDGEQIVAALEHTREQSNANLSKYLSPEQLAAAEKGLDESLERMSKQQVDSASEH